MLEYIYRIDSRRYLYLWGKTEDLEIINQRNYSYSKNATLRQLQLRMLNSLSKSPVVKLGRNYSKKDSQESDNYNKYLDKVNTSLSKYQINFSKFFLIY